MFSDSEIIEINHNRLFIVIKVEMNFRTIFSTVITFIVLSTKEEEKKLNYVWIITKKKRE